MTELPKLTTKQQSFVLRYCINDNNASEAYRYAYDCKNMSDEAINVEASKLMKNPKVTLWVEQAQSNVQQVIEDKIKYSALDCFNELDEVRLRAKKDKGCVEFHIEYIFGRSRQEKLAFTSNLSNTEFDYILKEMKELSAKYKVR